LTELRVHILYAGSCSHPEGMVLRGASWKPAVFPALVALLEHPTKGLALFDTGYTARFTEATRTMPNRIYRWLTPMTLGAGR
jgi:hypothetical protein